MASERVSDPYGGYFFALEVDGQEVAHFMECSGLKTTATVFEIEEGGMNGMTHKRPGQSKWDNIVLRYATSASQDLLSWRDRYLQDQFSSRPETSGSITLYDNERRQIRRYSFTSCWPVSWEGPQLNSGSSELAIETLEIAHEGLIVT
jgi:phage tail-like protein